MESFIRLLMLHLSNCFFFPLRIFSGVPICSVVENEPEKRDLSQGVFGGRGGCAAHPSQGYGWLQ